MRAIVVTLCLIAVFVTFSNQKRILVDNSGGACGGTPRTCGSLTLAFADFVTGDIMVLKQTLTFAWVDPAAKAHYVIHGENADATITDFGQASSDSSYTFVAVKFTSAAKSTFKSENDGFARFFGCTFTYSSTTEPMIEAEHNVHITLADCTISTEFIFKSLSAVDSADQGSFNLLGSSIIKAAKLPIQINMGSAAVTDYNININDNTFTGLLADTADIVTVQLPGTAQTAFFYANNNDIQKTAAATSSSAFRFIVRGYLQGAVTNNKVKTLSNSAGGISTSDNGNIDLYISSNTWDLASGGAPQQALNFGVGGTTKFLVRKDIIKNFSPNDKYQIECGGGTPRTCLKIKDVDLDLSDSSKYGIKVTVNTVNLFMSGTPLPNNAEGLNLAETKVIDTTAEYSTPQDVIKNNNGVTDAQLTLTSATEADAADTECSAANFNDKLPKLQPVTAVLDTFSGTTTNPVKVLANDIADPAEAGSIQAFYVNPFSALENFVLTIASNDVTVAAGPTALPTAPSDYFYYLIKDDTGGVAVGKVLETSAKIDNVQLEGGGLRVYFDTPVTITHSGFTGSSTYKIELFRENKSELIEQVAAGALGSSPFQATATITRVTELTMTTCYDAKITVTNGGNDFVVWSGKFAINVCNTMNLPRNLVCTTYATC